MFSSGKSSGVLKDPNFKDTVLLLHGDGTSGADNLSIFDSSPVTKTFNITNTPSNGFYGMVQGSFSPYLPNWSNYFNGSSYFTIPYTTTNFDWWTTDYTIEAWIYPIGTVYPSWVFNITYPCLIGNMSATTTSINWSFGINSTGQVCFYDANAGNKTSGLYVNGNSWNHIAMTKTSSGITFFCNGIGSGTSTTVSGSSTTGNTLTIGAFGGTYINGYVSNLRIIKGTALYSGTTYSVPADNFTSFTTNLTLLTCQANRIKDSSTLNQTATNTSTTTTPFSPFSPATPYNTSIHGGSLSLPAIAITYLQSTGDFSVGDGKLNSSGDFTVEAWVYPYSGRQDWISLTAPAVSSTIRLLLYYDGTSLTYYAGDTSLGPGPRITYAIAATQIANQWNHVAVVRKYPGYVTLAASQTSNLVQGSQTILTFSPTTGVFTAETATLTITNPALINATTAVFRSGVAPDVSSITLSGFLPATTTARTVSITCSSAIIDSYNATLTVTARTGGPITLGMVLSGTGVPTGTYITSWTGGTNGQNGTYNIYSPTGSLNFSSRNCTLTSPVTNINNNPFPILSISSAASVTTITFKLVGGWTISTKGSVYGLANFSITKLYLNGTQVGTGNVANNGSGTTGPAYIDQFNWPTLTTATIGKDSNSLTATTTNGYITDVRISRSAVYTATFTPNTTFLSGSSSILMLNFQNGKIYDSTANNHIATYNLGPSIDNTVSRYGGGSLYFNGTQSQFARFLNPDPIRIRNNNFTIEGWFYFNTLSTQTLFAFDTVTTGGFSAIRLDINSSGKLLLFMSSSGTTWDINGTNSSATVSASTWYHIAVVRSGSGSNNIQVYLNGTSTITATFTGSGYTAVTNVYTLGAVYNGSTPANYLYAFVDEFRVSKVARYTGNFGPQLRIFPDN